MKRGALLIARMDDAQLAVALSAGGFDWSWTAFVPVSTPLGNVVVLAQIDAEKGRLLPLSINDYHALEELGDAKFALSPHKNSAARWTAKSSLSSARSAAPLGVEINIADLAFQRRQHGDGIYFRVVYRGVSFPGYTNGVWLVDEDERSRRHGYTPLRLFDRDVILSEISKIGDDPDEWYVGVTVSKPYLSQLELDAIEMLVYLLSGASGIRQCVESYDADGRPISRSFHRLGHARKGDTNLIFPAEQYSKLEFYAQVVRMTEHAKYLIECGFPLRAVLYHVFASQQPVPEITITHLGIALDGIKNAVVVKIKGEGRLMEAKVFKKRIAPVARAAEAAFSGPEDTEALDAMLRAIGRANDRSHGERWKRFWRDHVSYELTDRERAVLEHRDPAVHEAYILRTEYDLALEQDKSVDRRPYDERLRDLDVDAKVYRNVVDRVLLLMLGYKGEFMDFCSPVGKLSTLRIVCLGWGSLIWDPRELRLRTQKKPWHRDGPELPIEFARRSKDDKITLVITEGAPPVPVLWADVDFDDVDKARSNLTEREWKGGDPHTVVGMWTESTSESSPCADRIAQWAQEKGVDAVIWTKLPPKFTEECRVPSKDEVVGHLASLPDDAKAKEYVRQTPVQIATPYRKEIEERLGWTYDGTQTGANIR